MKIYCPKHFTMYDKALGCDDCPPIVLAKTKLLSFKEIWDAARATPALTAALTRIHVSENTYRSFLADPNVVGWIDVLVDISPGPNAAPVPHKDTPVAQILGVYFHIEDLDDRDHTAYYY